MTTRKPREPGTRAKNNLIITDPKVRFWKHVKKTKTCWLWTASTRNRGYGSFFDGTRNVVAHRWLWTQIYGPIDKGIFLCHSCDNPTCVNPNHLFTGNHQDNMNDMKNKGRHWYKTQPERVKEHATKMSQLRKVRGYTYGEQCQTSKYKESQVIKILEDHNSGLTAKELSARHQIPLPTIRSIITGRTWKHLAKYKQAVEGKE